MTANFVRRGSGRGDTSLEGERSDDRLPRRLRDLSPEERARQLCLDSLERRMRTRKQLAQLLSRKRVEPEIAESVLDRLQEVGLINDEAYARAFVTSRQRTRPRGTRALSSELWAKGIPAEVVDRVLAESAEAEDPKDAARRAVGPKLRQLAGKPPDEVRHKLEQFLLRRGFSYETARDVLRDVSDADDSLA
jgi:regulatory protein